MFILNKITHYYYEVTWKFFHNNFYNQQKLFDELKYTIFL